MEQQYPGSHYQPLFDLMMNEYNLALLHTELSDIIDVVRKMEVQPPHIRKEDIESEWDKLWKDIVTNPDGSINIEQLKKELYDFSYVMEQVPKVYCHITGDRLSKIMYPAETVISVSDDYTNEIVEREIKESEMQGEIAFAEWTAKGLWSTHDGMWYEYQNQDNPISGEQLHALYQQSLNK